MSKIIPLSEAQQQAIRWKSRLSNRKCSDKVKQDFDNWFNASAENAEAFQTIQYFWDQFGHIQTIGESELNEARRFAKTSQTSHRQRNLTLVLLVAAFALTAVRPDWALKLTSQHYQTAKGDVINIELSDGSTIKLNTDSDIKVADILGWRKAWLDKGEAWFAIQHDAEKPFEVFAGQARIKDIGTQFNVFTDTNKTTVSVQEGEVALESDNDQLLRLTANQQGSVDQRGHVTEKIDINSETIGSWRSGLLIFQNQSLSDVLKKLSRYHQAEFNVLDGNLQNLVISGRFSTTKLDETLNTLSQAMNLNIEQYQSGQFLISKATKR